MGGSARVRAKPRNQPVHSVAFSAGLPAHVAEPDLGSSTQLIRIVHQPHRTNLGGVVVEGQTKVLVRVSVFREPLPRAVFRVAQHNHRDPVAHVRDERVAPGLSTTP